MNPGGAGPRRLRSRGLVLRSLTLCAAYGLLLACAGRKLPPPELAPVRYPEAHFPSADCQRRAEALLGEMTLAEKVGQLVIADANVTRRAEVAAFSIGSVLAPMTKTPNEALPRAWLERSTRFHEAGERAGLRIPLVYAVDIVGGAIDVEGAVVFPAPIALGATRDAELVTRVYAAVGRELSALGADLAFAPSASVASDASFSRTFETFGADPELVAEMTRAAVGGLQGTPGDRAGAVLACIGGFPADGTAAGAGGIELGAGALREKCLPPFRAAVDSGAACVRLSGQRFEGKLASENRELVTTLLKHDIGFNGFVVAPWQSVSALDGEPRDQLATVFEAGADVVLGPPSPEGVIRQLRELSARGGASRRIDDAAFRVLAAKCEIGLLKPERRVRPRLDVVGRSEHRELARETVARSVVLLKNERRILPLSSKSVIQLLGSRADDLPSQFGPDAAGVLAHRLTGTTIKRALEREVGKGRVRFMRSAQPSRGAWVSLAVVGPPVGSAGTGRQSQSAAPPRAKELSGAPDRSMLELDPADVELVAALRHNGLPVVVVLLTGTPVPLPPEVLAADAIVAAWLPGSEASGLADVLFGHRPFTGRLPQAWPRASRARTGAAREPGGHAAPTGPREAGDPGSDPEYPLGFGLGG